MTQAIKKEFFAYRNGIVASQLRAAGDPHEIIMGCLFADIIAITRHYERDAKLAQDLWNDTRYRECRLAAPMLYPIEEFSKETALTWCRSIESLEVADVLCHRLLKHLSYARELSQQLAQSDDAMQQYTARRLTINLDE